MKKIIILISLVLSTSAYSAELILGGLSYHPSKSYTEHGKVIKYNNQNKLFAIEANQFVFASFKNSYYEQTKAIGYEFKINKYFGVMPLLTDNYDDITPLKLGRVNLMGMLTFKAGPIVMLFVPRTAYTLAFKFGL